MRRVKHTLSFVIDISHLFEIFFEVLFMWSFFVKKDSFNKKYYLGSRVQRVRDRGRQDNQAHRQALHLQGRSSIWDAFECCRFGFGSYFGLETININMSETAVKAHYQDIQDMRFFSFSRFTTLILRPPRSYACRFLLCIKPASPVSNQSLSYDWKIAAWPTYSHIPSTSSRATALALALAPSNFTSFPETPSLLIR